MVHIYGYVTSFVFNYIVWSPSLVYVVYIVYVLIKDT